MSNRFTPEQLKAVADAAKKQKASQKQETEGSRLSQKTRQQLEKDVLEGFKKNIRFETLSADEKKLNDTLSSLEKRQKNNIYVDPKEWEDAMTAVVDLSNRYRYYGHYLDRYGYEGVNKTAVRDASRQYQDVYSNLGSMRDFYGQFKDVNEFQAYTDKKKREDYLINEYDLESAKQELDAAKQELDAAKLELDPAKYDYAKKRYETLDEEYRQATKLKRIANYDTLTQNPDFVVFDAMQYPSYYFPPASSLVGENGKKFDAMTDDERKIYAYLAKTQGQEAAEDYFYDIGDELAYRVAGNQKKTIDSILPDNWFGDAVGGALSIGNAFASGLTDATSSFFEGVYQRFAQNDRVQNTSILTARVALDKEEAGKVQKVLLDLAQTTGNMIPSIVVSTATGVPILGAGMMGVQAKGAAYNQAIKEGYSPSQAQTYSTMVGAAETAIGYALSGIGALGRGGLAKIIPPLGKGIAGISNGFLRGLASLGVKMSSEALEEGLTEMLTPLFKNLATGSHETINWEDVGYSALLGALSAGLLEGNNAISEAKLPERTAEAFKTKYDTDGTYDGFVSRLSADDTLISLKIIEMVKEDNANGAVDALNDGIKNYRFAKEYVGRAYGRSASELFDQRIQTLETLKASIKAGKFNAQSAETALRKTSDIWQIAAENNDAVVDALTSGNLSNSKIEQKVLKDRGTINAFKRKTGVDLDSLSTISQKRQAVREASAGYQAFVQTDAYRTMQELTKANETEKDASKVVANKRSIIDGMLALHNQAMAEADAARRNNNNELADQKEMVARLADAALNSTRNDKASYFASNRSSAVDYDELSALGDQYLKSLSAEDRSTLTGVRSVADLKRAEVAVKEKLNKQRDEAVSKKAKRAVERRLQAVDAYFVSAMTSLQNVNDTALAEARTIVDKRIKAMNKNLRRYGVTVDGFANGIRYFDTDGKEISYDEVLKKQRRGEAVRMNVVRGMNSERTLAIARDIASGVVPVMNPLNGQIVQMKVGRGEGMVSPERAVDIILAHEAVHYAEKYGQSGLVDSIIHKIAGTRLDTQYELANRLKNRPVSEAAAKNWDKLKNTYADVIAKERKISREEALSKVDDAYLYEEIAADYMGTLMANNSFAEALAAQDGHLFKRIVRAIRDLLEGLRNGGMVNHERAAKDLATRLEAIAKKTYGRMEKKVDASTSEKAAESPVGNVPAEEGTNEGDTANDGDAQEKAGDGAEMVMENAEGEVEKRYSVGETEDGINYVRLDGNIFLRPDGTVMSPSEAYNALVGTQITLKDGDVINFIKKLPDVRLYHELFRKYPGHDGSVNIKPLNEAINKNIVDVFAVSNAKERNEKQIHEHEGIVDFDLREVYIADDRSAYRLELYVANLTDGSKAAYVKRYVEKADPEIAEKIKKAETVRQTHLNQPSDVEGVKTIDAASIEDSIAPNSQIVNSKFSVSEEMDADYMSAVESGDTETAQLMVDEAAKNAGYSVKAYHGTGRADRVGNVFRTDRATSGPMAFFTDSKDIASNYARDKADTSLAYDEEYDSYYTQFRVNRNGKSVSIPELWKYLSVAERNRIKEQAGHIKFDDDYETIIVDESAQHGNGAWDAYTLNSHRGNALEALIDTWLESGDLYNQEELFLEVLKNVGLTGVEYRNPDARYEKVYDTWLKITNPFDTDNADQSFYDGLSEWIDNNDMSVYEKETANADMWDKNNQTPESWLENLEYDIESGTTHAWTVIPDFVTDYLKSQGFDGIKDKGGKGGGEGHTVWIPFSSEQVKSAESITRDDNGNVIPLSERFNEKESDIRYSVAGEASLDADAGELDRAWQMYQKGDSKNDIVRETGWWIGKDGKWRYEISDEDMDFDRDGFVKNPKTVGDYVKHNRLFKAYPQLRDIRVKFVDKVGDSDSAKGTYQKNAKTIQIRKNVVGAEAKEVVLHELQHAIQHIEGFKRGSSKKTGGMLVFNEIYRHVKRYPRFQNLNSKSAKFNYVKAMADIEGGSPFDLLARDAYLNDHGEFEARKTVERMNMPQEQLRNEHYFNDGIVLDNDLIKQNFIDNLLEIGYNRKQASQIAEEGFFNDYQRKDGSQLDDARNAGHEGQGTGQGRKNVSGNYDLQDGRQRQVHGAGEISVSDASTEKNGNRSGRGRVNQEPSTRYSASGDISMDDGAVGYEELKRQVAEQKEQIHRLTEEMVLSHGTHLDVKETGRFLNELLTRYGATLTVKDIEADVNDITEYLYRKYDVTRDEQGRFVSKEKVKEIDAAKLNDRIQRLATRIMESAVDVDSRFEEYTSFLKTLHNTPIGITEEIKQTYGDGWGAFRQRNFGRLNLRNAETSDLAAFYQEMADNYPEILDSSISDPVEQLKQLADAAKTIRETGLEPKNIYGLDGESVVADIAYDFSSGIASIDPAMNFADKAQQKVEDAKAAGKQAVKTEGRRGDFRVAEQRLADDMYYGKKIAAIRERYEARLDEMAERFATKVKDRSEEQQVRYQKKMIEKRGKDLAKRLAKPSKAKHIPEDMVPDVYRLLDKIRWAAKTKFDQEVAAQVSSYLDAVKKRYPNSDDLKLPEGSGFSESLRSEIEAYDLGSMDDQNAQQLHGLNELLRRAIFEINAYDKVFHSGEKASAASLKARDQFRLARNEESKKGWVLLTRDRIIKAIDSIQDPEHFFTILNVPVLTEALHNIGKSQDQYAKYIRTFANDLSDMVNNIYGDKGIPREVREDTQDYTTQSGKTLTFTTADLIMFYLYTQQEDSLKCLKNPAGGIAFATTEKRSKVDGTVYQKIRGGRSRLTETDIANLNNILAKDTKAMEMAKRLSRFLNTTVSDVANKVSLETEGYRKYIIENYFPMMVYDENKTFDKIAGDAAAKVINYGFSKERTGLSGKTLLAGDVFTVVEKHATAVAQYAAYRKAILDFVKILNVRPDGQSNLRTDLKAFFGDKEDNRVIKFIDNFLSDLQLAQIKTGEDTLLSEKLLQRYKAAQVALNFSVIAKQPLSIIRAWPEFSAKGFAALMNPLAMGPKAWKAARDEMIEHSGLAQMKAWGFSENANANSFSQLYNKKGTQTWRSKTDDVSSFLAEEADMLTWARIWNACKAETNTIEETTEKFNEVIRKTQVVNTITTASHITQQGGIKSFLFAFKNEPIKSFNYFRSSLSDALMGKEGAKAKMAKVAVSSAISTIVTSAVSAAFWIGRDDEENTMEKFLDGWKENALEDLFNNTFIFLGDLVSVFQNYGTWDTVERMDMAGLNDLLQAIYGVVDVLQKDPQKQKNTGWKVTYDLVRALSNVTGLPVGNIARMARSISWTVADLSDDPMTKYGVEAFWYNAEGVSNATVRKRFKNILSDALDNKDYKGFAEVSTVLRTKGFNSQYIQDAIGESDVFYDAFNEGPEAFRNEVDAAQKYDPTISSTSVMAAIKSRKTELVSNLYDAAKVGDKQAMQAVRDELLQLRDVETKQLLTDKAIDRLLKEKYEKQLKSDVKERLVDLYGTEVYETIKRVILSEYRKFGVTSEEIDRIARSLR